MAKWAPICLPTATKTAAQAAAQKYAAWFPDAFYLELQRLPERPQWETSVAGSLQIAAALDLPVVATQPIQFPRPDDFEAHEARVCIAERLGVGQYQAPAPNLRQEPVF